MKNNVRNVIRGIRGRTDAVNFNVVAINVEICMSKVARTFTSY